MGIEESFFTEEVEFASLYHINVPQFWYFFISDIFHSSTPLFPAVLIFSNQTTQLTFTCSKSKIETLEKAVKCVQSYNKKHQNDVIDRFHVVSMWNTRGVFVGLIVISRPQNVYLLSFVDFYY